MDRRPQRFPTTCLGKQARQLAGAALLSQVSCVQLWQQQGRAAHTSLRPSTCSSGKQNTSHLACRAQAIATADCRLALDAATPPPAPVPGAPAPALPPPQLRALASFTPRRGGRAGMVDLMKLIWGNMMRGQSGHAADWQALVVAQRMCSLPHMPSFSGAPCRLLPARSTRP